MICRLGLLFVVLASSGCRASASASAEVKTQQSEAYEPEDSQADSEPDPQEVALLGARHDLRLAQVGAPICQCLFVKLGGAQDTAFSWESTTPVLDDSSQIVIALSSEGVECPGAGADAPGASYWGYQLSGEDVVVVVESARGGRPVAEGAIIPRPQGSGRVLLKPRSKSVPYGRDLNSKDLCQIPIKTK